MLNQTAKRVIQGLPGENCQCPIDGMNIYDQFGDIYNVQQVQAM